MLTPKQQALTEEHHSLIYSFLHSNNLPVDDYYGDCAVGLCKAAATYRPERGAFSTWAYRVMRNEVYMALRLEHRSPHTTSLDAARTTEGDSIEDKLGYIDPTQTETTEAMQQITQHLTSRDRRILELTLEGKRQGSIARTMGIDQTTVSRALGKIKRKYKEGSTC